MIYFDENNKQINNGDIYDIGQSVNGCSTFLFLYFPVEGYYEIFYYFNNKIQGEYEYNKWDILDTVRNPYGIENVTFVKNFFN